MIGKFDCFVVFAEMRTGSNFLESNLNALDGVTCYGEAFNPSFVGYPKSEEVLGVTLQDRAADPDLLLDRIRNGTQGLGGFRFFHDHDGRILQRLLEDERCAKILLTRNPVDSYVSWKIAQTTGQWKLTHVKRHRDAKAVFDAGEFDAYLSAVQEFRTMLMHALQTTGQSAFHIGYDDLQDVEVMNGLARWLGAPGRLSGLETALKRQNPKPVADKVANFDAMQDALRRRDPFDLGLTAHFEPKRSAVVSGYVGGARTALLYMPVLSGPDATVTRWLAALDDVSEQELARDFSQNELRAWKSARDGHRSFTVIRHPVARAHEAFCTRILPAGHGAFSQIRKVLRRAHKLPIPQGGPGARYDLAAHRAAFAAWLRFLKANLAGQTSVRVDAHWASQSEVIHGMSGICPPDMIVREDEMSDYLPALALQVGHPAPAEPRIVPDPAPFTLEEVYDDEIESLARQAYARDYVMFGLRSWR